MIIKKCPYEAEILARKCVDMHGPVMGRFIGKDGVAAIEKKNRAEASKRGWETRRAKEQKCWEKR